MSTKLRFFFTTVTSSAPRAEEISIPDAKVVLMKQLTWLVMLAYTLLMIKPILPVIADAMAHSFWKSQHILTVHEVNGKFHVHKELVKASKDDEKRKQHTGNKFENSDYVHVPYAAISVVVFPATISIYATYKSNYTSFHVNSDYPPPKYAGAAFSAQHDIDVRWILLSTIA